MPNFKIPNLKKPNFKYILKLLLDILNRQLRPLEASRINGGGGGNSI